MNPEQNRAIFFFFFPFFCLFTFSPFFSLSSLTSFLSLPSGTAPRPTRPAAATISSPEPSSGRRAYSSRHAINAEASPTHTCSAPCHPLLHATSSPSPPARTRLPFAPGHARARTWCVQGPTQARFKRTIDLNLAASSGQLGWTSDQPGPTLNQPKTVPIHLVREWLVCVKPSLFVAFIFGQRLIRSKLPPRRRRLTQRIGTYGSQFRRP